MIEKGHTIYEYVDKYGDYYEDGDLWDFTKEDIDNGAVELDEERIYWEIDDRVYETYEK